MICVPRAGSRRRCRLGAERRHSRRPGCGCGRRGCRRCRKRGASSSRRAEAPRCNSRGCGDRRGRRGRNRLHERAGELRTAVDSGCARRRHWQSSLDTGPRDLRPEAVCATGRSTQPLRSVSPPVHEAFRRAAAARGGHGRIVRPPVRAAAPKVAPDRAPVPTPTERRDDRRAAGCRGGCVAGLRRPAVAATGREASEAASSSSSRHRTRTRCS